MSPEGTGQGGSPTAEGGDKQLVCAGRPNFTPRPCHFTPCSLRCRLRHGAGAVPTLTDGVKALVCLCLQTLAEQRLEPEPVLSETSLPPPPPGWTRLSKVKPGFPPVWPSGPCPQHLVTRLFLGSVVRRLFSAKGRNSAKTLYNFKKLGKKKMVGRESSSLLFLMNKIVNI